MCLVMWINIVLNEEFALYPSTVKCLTVVSRYFASTLKSYIERNYWFDLSNGRRLVHYSPLNQKQVLDVSEILPSTKKLVFHDEFNKTVNNLLSHQITHLKFGRFYNCSTSDLPLSLTHIEFDFWFEQPLLRLPPRVEQVIFGIYYNEKVDHLSKQIRFLRYHQQSKEDPIEYFPYKYHFPILITEVD
eukprot:TRINITY_DN1728_c0_g1_i4.p1 TRINITY_DN1728_c0_g1~~TRINITY_DN1728_c0_g1_i4.p1  ORF type:complete len:188 (+),score=17.46 TRINITY_DN1728_c0_g1_i4:310-873(+)